MSSSCVSSGFIKQFSGSIEKSHHMIPGHSINTVNCSIHLVLSTSIVLAFKNAHNEKYRVANLGGCSLDLFQGAHHYYSALLLLLFHLGALGNSQLKHWHSLCHKS